MYHRHIAVNMSVVESSLGYHIRRSARSTISSSRRLWNCRGGVQRPLYLDRSHQAESAHHEGQVVHLSIPSLSHPRFWQVGRYQTISRLGSGAAKARGGRSTPSGLVMKVLMSGLDSKWDAKWQFGVFWTIPMSLNYSASLILILEGHRVWCPHIFVETTWWNTSEDTLSWYCQRSSLRQTCCYCLPGF